MADETGRPAQGPDDPFADVSAHGLHPPLGGGASRQGIDASRGDERSAGARSGPAGEVYDWYTRGMALLGHGDANAAVQLLAHAVAAEPGSPSVREALGRAQFSAGQYLAARETFAWIVDRHPTDDYAQFGLGLSARKIGDLRAAVEHLALAVAMRPDISHYGVALRGARAALART
ncbi:lipopolysaccharide assembly protein LapB [Frankia sp. AiPa1]|uniref:tetratricopeptide repeat protein n=1 Tax=Frankia sp. AiPa1 TaxID=573492 RepID=UPI00202B4CE1|nr:tetratricopeptide repeat protein [Frankia sp. AiPa1]MCL9759621.1 tetratricopeptide repeat protein [Frankia sp. AiPa1]